MHPRASSLADSCDTVWPMEDTSSSPRFWPGGALEVANSQQVVGALKDNAYSIGYVESDQGIDSGGWHACVCVRARARARVCVYVLNCARLVRV